MDHVGDDQYDEEWVQCLPEWPEVEDCDSGPENPELVLEANQPPHAEDGSQNEGGDRLGHGGLRLALGELGKGARVPLGEETELGLDDVERHKDQGHPGEDG